MARTLQGLLQVDRHQLRGGLLSGDGRVPEVPCQLIALGQQRGQDAFRQHQS